VLVFSGRLKVANPFFHLTADQLKHNTTKANLVGPFGICLGPI
jgi:hypothetical protein